MSSAPHRPTGGLRGWTRSQVVVLLVLLLVVTSNYVDRSLLGILQEPVKQELKFSDWQLGLISGPSFAIFYALSGLPSARWAERNNRATILSILLACWSGMTALCGAAQNFVHLALARAGVGLGEGGCIPVSHALVSEHFPARTRGMAMAVLSCASPLGGIVAAAGGAAIAEAWGWRAAFLLLGLPGIALAFVVRALITDPRAADKDREIEKPNFRRDIGWLLGHRAFVLLVLANAVNSIANSGIMMFTASYFLRQYDLSLKEVGFIYAGGVGVAGLVGTLVSGVLADRFAGENGRSYALIPALGAGLAAVFFLLAFTREIWWVAVILLVAANLATDFKTPSLAAVQSLAPRRIRATAAAVLFLGVTFLGAGLGPPLAGLISDIMAGQAFAGGDFATLCPGGAAIAGSAQAMTDQCRAASAAGVRGGLTAAACLYFVAMTLFYLASRSLRLNLNEDAAA